MIEYCLLIYLTCADTKCIPPASANMVVLSGNSHHFRTKKQCEKYYRDENPMYHARYYGHTCWGKRDESIGCTGFPR